MPEPHENLHFGAIAIKLGFTTLEKVDECLRLQEKMKELGVAPKKLGEIMLAKGYVTEGQVKEIFKYQGMKGGHTSIHGYKILTKIGQGAMGSIYKALQISMDRIVAIKCLAPKYSQNDKFRERFLREARAVARLNHPNIIQGIDVGDSNGVHYFAMEYIDGPTVGELLKRGGALDEKRALNIVTQIARALQHAFNHTIIHRDIKPDNIMLTREGVAKLCDLGLAKDRPEGGRALGTPHYISPEQAEGIREADIRSDLYSFGATLYHMLAGRTPFEGKAKPVMVKHISEDPVPLREIDPDISDAMAALVQKLMRKRPEDRFQSPRELIGALEAYETAQRQKAAAQPSVAPPRVVRRRRR